MNADIPMFFDPIDGQPIHANTFRERYGLTSLHAVEIERSGRERAARGATQATMPGLKTFGARCLGCGTDVVPREGQPNVCPMCADKPAFRAPVASRQLGEQPTPAYVKREEPAITEPAPLAAGTVLGGATSDGH
jgi:hypothetical protein